MAQHWSTFIAVSDKQARALDTMASDHGHTDGRELLVKVSGYSSSKLSRQNRATMQRYVDTCFTRWGVR